MKSKAFFILILTGWFFMSSLNAQRKDIAVSEVPATVIGVLNQYVQILSSSASLNDCATKVVSICGGHLLTQDGNQISNDVKPYSLKKDFENVKFYKNPPVITRVQLQKNTYDGYGPTLIEGDLYKIWIAKKDGVQGLPAPIPIIVPKNNPSKPKVVSNIGSL